MDFFCTPDGEILLNEIGTMPGMTAASYVPKCGRPAGFVAEFIDRLITTAMRKPPGLR